MVLCFGCINIILSQRFLVENNYILPSYHFDVFMAKKLNLFNFVD